MPGSPYKLWWHGIFLFLLCSVVKLSIFSNVPVAEKIRLLCFMFKYLIRQVVNMEWGNFWSSHLPRTPYDISLDDETQNRNDQVTLSGKYLMQYLYPWLVSIAEQNCH